MEADLKRIDAMEEDQEVTSRLQAEFTMGELPSLAVPTSVTPFNSRFLSYENMKKSFTCSPAVTGKLRKENMDLKQQVNKLEQENRILKGIIAKKIMTQTVKKGT